MNFYDNQTYEKTDYSLRPIEKGGYENCLFRHCNFSESDLSGVNFTDCRFEDCNLSMAKINNTQLNGITFSNCKMLGLKFEHCNPFLFEVRFAGCLLDLSSFYKVKLKKTRFESCTLHEVDFSQADLTEAVLAECDLRGAVFDFTTLVKTDFRTSVHYSIHPENNKIKKARFSREGIAGLLDRYDIIIE